MLNHICWVCDRFKSYFEMLWCKRSVHAIQTLDKYSITLTGFSTISKKYCVIITEGSICILTVPERMTHSGPDSRYSITFVYEKCNGTWFRIGYALVQLVPSRVSQKLLRLRVFNLENLKETYHEILQICKNFCQDSFRNSGENFSMGCPSESFKHISMKSIMEIELNRG